MLCMNEEVASGELFQTAIREDDEYNNSDETLSLPKTKNKKVPKVKGGVLRGINFEPPSSESLMRAYRFRVAFFGSLRPLGSDEEKPPSTALKCYDVKRVQRNRKAHNTAEISITENKLSNESLNKTQTYLLDDLGDDWSDYDFDAKSDDEEELSKAPVVESHSQTAYMSTCKSLRVIPSSHFFKSLATSKSMMKHQILGPEGVKACAVALLSNAFVTKLHFEDNGMGAKGASSISQLLTENVLITDLTISHNNLGGAGLRSISEVMKVNERIKRLDLSGNNLEETDAEHIAEIIETNNILEELILSHNRFGEAGGVIIAKALVLTRSLTVLNLSWNHLRRLGVTALADAMTVNCSIEVLDLSWNGIAMEGCKTLGRALTQNRSLRELDLSNGRINVTSLSELLKGLKENTSLQILKLGHNSLAIASPVAILQVLKDCPDLPIKELDLEGQTVDLRFTALLEEVRETRPLAVRHGVVIARDTSDGQADIGFENDNPMMVLMECMRLQNLRLVDFFSTLDKDGSRSLGYAEFRDGLQSINVPLTYKQVDKLIKKLDEDGDGEVDFKELIDGQKEYKTKLHKMNQRQKGVPYEETEIGRISVKVKAKMALRQTSKGK